MKPRRFIIPIVASLSFTGIAHAANFTWSSGVNADWNSNNWGGGFPNASGDVAQYVSTTANATTALTTNTTVGQILGNDPGKLWIISSSGGALTLDNTGGTANVFTNNNAAISASGAAADGEALRVAAAVSLANTDLDIGMTNGGMSVTGAITATTNQTLTFRNNASIASHHMVISGSIGLTGAGNIALVNSSTRATDVPSGANASGVLLSGTIGTHVTGITHNSPGGIFLTGFNSFTGPLSISGSGTAGLLGINSNAALGASANTVTLNNALLSNIVISSTTSAYSSGGNLDLPASRNITLGAGGGGIRNAFTKVITVNGVIDGTGKFDRTDGGTVVLNGLNTYTGVTTLLAGTTRVSVINNGGTPGNLGAASSAAANLVFGASSIVQYIGDTASTDRSFTLAAGVAGIFEILRSETNLTLGGSVPASTGALTKNGAGTLTLTGSSAYTGTTTVNLGTLAVNGSLTSNILIGGATLTGSGTTTGTITFNNVAGAGVLASPSGSNAVQGTNLVLNGTTDIYTNQLGDFTTATGSGPLKVLRYTGAQSGAGAFVAATNYRSGLLTNSSGLVSLEYKAEAKTWSATTGGTWDVNTSTPSTGTADSLFFWGDSAAFGDTAADQTVTLTGNLAPSAITVSNSANTYTFSGTGGIRGSTSLVKSGAGTLALNNTSSTFTGGVIVSSGTVSTNVASGATFGNGSVTLGDANTGANATSLLFTGTTAAQTMAKSIVVSPLGTGTVTIGTGAVAADNFTYNGIYLNRATTLKNGATASSRVNFRGLTGNVGTLTIAAPTTAANRVVFELGDNTFTGDLTIASSAVLQLGAAGTVADTIPDASNVTVNGTLNLSFSSVGETINGLSGTGIIGTNSSTNNTLTIGAANGGGNFAGQLTQGSTGNPALAIRKVGTGTQTISGSATANNYSGGTDRGWRHAHAVKGSGLRQLHRFCRHRCPDDQSRWHGDHHRGLRDRRTLHLQHPCDQRQRRDAQSGGLRVRPDL
ncbi:MAG: autotransporter-associated beta strand repeat-containing protein [Luteolibacter sp.]